MVTKKKGQAKNVNDGIPRCAFCGQPGLTEDQIPLTDEQNEKRLMLLRQNDMDSSCLPKELQRPISYDFKFEFNYGEWIVDNRLDVDETKTSHKMRLDCHERCLISSPELYANHDDPEAENFLPEDDVKYTLGRRGFTRDAIIKEVRRGQRLKCALCGKSGANIGCVINSCSKKFHYPCAVGQFICCDTI